MDDHIVIVARQLLWDKNAWREPAFLNFVIRTLEQSVADEDASSAYRTEAKMLIKQLYMAGKKPAGAF